MSRTDDFAKAGQALAETKRTSKAQAQCRYDFDIAAEHGYQYAIDKACEWLSKIDVNEYLKIVPGFGYVIEDGDAIKDFRKAMED